MEASQKMKRIDPSVFIVMAVGLIIFLAVFIVPSLSANPYTETQITTIELTGNEQMTNPLPGAFSKTINENYWITGFFNGSNCWWHLHQKGNPVPVVDESPFACPDTESFLKNVFNRLGLTYGPYAQALDEFLQLFVNFTPPPALP